MKWETSARVAVSGLVWAGVYNGLWAIAWFAFMSREWQTAFAAVGRPLAWTGEVWFAWVVITVPLGLALMAHVIGSPRRFLSAVRGAAALFVVFSVGMTIWGVHESLSLRVLALDAMVNALAMPIAAIAAAAILPREARTGSLSA
jgi:hypothetical protein